MIAKWHPTGMSQMQNEMLTCMHNAHRNYSYMHTPRGYMVKKVHFRPTPASFRMAACRLVCYKKRCS